MVRFSRDASDAVVSQEHPLFLEYTGTNTKYFTAQHEHIFGSSAVNSLRVAVNNPTRTDDVQPTVDVPKSLYFTEDPHFGAITVIGLTQVGSTATIPADYDQLIYQVADTFTWNRGNHSGSPASTGSGTTSTAVRTRG